ncbi:MAG: exodeoxyribonuclease VII small subunit [Burkholderiales bacterium]|jgi:exodeoxyribonuclease VII small subunit|nr:exodeoxyribonuclease VII small subunit [Burkholderiales bacterium]
MAKSPVASTSASTGAFASTPANFEAAMTELEDIVARMEQGSLPLAEALASYQRGAVLLTYCQNALRDAQQQVQVLEDNMLKAFNDDDTARDD